MIIDGDGSELLPRSCNITIPEPITTRTSQATLIFFSDTSLIERGFQADLSAGVSLILLNVTQTGDTTPGVRQTQELKEIAEERQKSDTAQRLNPIQIIFL